MKKGNMPRSKVRKLKFNLIAPVVVWKEFQVIHINAYYALISNYVSHAMLITNTLSIHSSVKMVMEDGEGHNKEGQTN